MRVSFCPRDLQNSDEVGRRVSKMGENGHAIIRHPSYQPANKLSLQWLDLRVFYVRLSRCVIDDESTPDHLTLNHVPLNQHTLLEVNCVRTSIYSDGVSTLLKRDRLDKKSEEVTFVSTDSIRTTGSVKFEVFHKDILVLWGTLDLCHSNGFLGESKCQGMSWTMNCDSGTHTSSTFLKENRNHHAPLEPASPTIEVYVAGCFSGSPIILTKTLQLNHRRKQMRKGVVLESIPENETTTQSQNDDSSSTLAMQPRPNQEYSLHEEGLHMNPYMGMEYTENEDGELSWFNAGVRVGVGIGLSICLGLGIGVGLLVRTYQGTTRNFRRRLL